jgi:STE24 endopeptidase
MFNFEFSQIFLFFVALYFLTKFWLNLRQIRAVQESINQVPEQFSNKITLEDHQKAARYTTTKIRIGQFEMILDTIILLLWTVVGGINLLNEWVMGLQYSTILSGIVLLLSFTFISSFISLPFSLYSTFVVEEKFGFNKTTPKTFIVDMAKGIALGLIIGVPLLWVILTLMESAGEYWWFYAWAVFMGFNLFLMWAYPVFIAPLFNKFSELEDKELMEKITNLLDRCGFKSKGVFVMDGSKRSGHGNAYFTGFGANKRIVFYDTLLESLSHNQVEAVLAHELGHFKHKHIVKSIFFMAASNLIGLAILGWLMNQDWFYSQMSIQSQSTAVALLLFMLVMPVFTFMLQPAFSYLSRKHEFEADEFAAQQASADDLITALVSMYKENASTLTPDNIYSSFYDSHPPASIRINHLKKIGALT